MRDKRTPKDVCGEAIESTAEEVSFEWSHHKISSAYHLYGKPGNSVENSNGTVHPGGNFPERK